VTDLSPEATVLGLFEALNERDFGRAAGAVSERCRWESVAAETVHRGSGPIADGLRTFTESFPDLRIDVESVTADGRRVVVEWAASGTFTGAPLRGEQANGRSFRRRGCAVAEVDGGKIVRYRDYYDRATLLDQLGLRHLL
jgi:steroid delta-isomerase-like uncharacterized protein